MLVTCAKCGFAAERPAVFRSDTCEKCGADLKSCVQCRHFDVNARWECRENISERVAEKERANFCDWFQARVTLPSVETEKVGAGAPVAVPDAREAMRKAAEALFKKGS